MSFSTFIRDTAYFQSRRDQQMMINAEDFDLQFNNLVRYINDKIRTAFNNLQKGEIVGTDEEGTEGAFLRNIGDGNTEWVTINNDAVDDNSITFTKFIQSAPGSIFATAGDRIFRTVTPTDNNLALISTANNLPVWQRLKGENFEDRQILGNNIAYNCIGAELLAPGVIGRALDANSVLASHISDLSIPGTKIADGALTANKFDPNLIAQRNARLIDNYGFTITDNALEGRHFADNFFSNKLTRNAAPYSQDDNVNYTFTPENIADNSITRDLFSLGGRYDLGIDTTRCFAPGAIHRGHIMDNSFPPFTNYLPQGVLRKEKLHYTIRDKLGI